MPGSTARVAGVAVDTRHWIGGRRVGSSGTFTDISPIDEQPIAEVARGGAAEAGEAVAAARLAFPGWAATPAADRAKALHAIADGVEARIEDLAQVETRDNGSLLRSHRRSVMPRVAHNFRFFADWLGRLDGGDLEISGHREQVSWDPAGVTAVITPWNAPLMLATWRIAPALAAGNTVVAKPPEWAPLTASLLADITHEAGLPDGVFNVVQGLGAEAGAPLVAHSGLARVAFTGSVATGRQVAAAAGAQLTPVSLELGGKSPLIVFADADLDLAVGHAVGQFDNAGQVCLAGTRLLVDQAIAGEFTAAFAARAAVLRQGDPRDEATDIGPNISRAHLDRVDGYVRRALAAGAKPLLGGSVNPALGGLYYQPTLLGGARARRGDPHRGSVRPGAHPADLRHRGRGGGAGQQHPVRAGRHDVHRRRRPGAAGVRPAGRRHRVGELFLRPRPARAVRRRRASPASAARAARGASTSTAT